MNGRIIPFEGSMHAQADRLLPWYVNGSLSEDERRQVEQHLTECLPCQHEVTWLRALQDEYAGDRADIDDNSLAIRRLRRRMENARTTSSPPLVWKRHGRLLTWVAAAQAAAILTLGAALFFRPPSAYHTLSTPGDKSALLVVVFDPHTSEAQLRQLIRARGARIVDGPTEAGAYVLRVPEARRADARKLLRQAAEVTLVEDLGTSTKP